jgi:hypothetical protein
MPRQSHPACFDNRNNIRWSVKVMKLLVTQSSPNSRQFLRLRSKFYRILWNYFIKILYWEIMMEIRLPGTTCIFFLSPLNYLVSHPMKAFRCIGGGWEFFSLPPRPERLWGLPSLLSNGYQGIFPGG